MTSCIMLQFHVGDDFALSIEDSHWLLGHEDGLVFLYA